MNGEQIRTRRDALGLSQAELAALVGHGCKQQDIYRLELPPPKGTKNSKYMAAILATLDRLEGAAKPVSESNSPAGLARDEVLAVLEVLLRRWSKSDMAAEWAAQALLQELENPAPLPYKLDRASYVRSEAHRIIRSLSEEEH